MLFTYCASPADEALALVMLRHFLARQTFALDPGPFRDLYPLSVTRLMSRGAFERISSKTMSGGAKCRPREGWWWTSVGVYEIARWSSAKVMFEARNLARAILLPARVPQTPIMMQTHVAVIRRYARLSLCANRGRIYNLVAWPIATSSWHAYSAYSRRPITLVQWLSIMLSKPS